MHIESFHIQGFKSLADVKVVGLSDINVFYGLNNVGKSNIFQALGLWYKALKASRSKSYQISLEKFSVDFGSFLFRLGNSDTIELSVDVVIDKKDILEKNISKSIASQIESRFAYLNKNTMQLSSTVNIDLKSDEVFFRIQNSWEGSGNFDLHPKDLTSILPVIHIVKAKRRFQTEQRGKENNLTPISDHNLKQALFYAYLSPKPRQKQRLASITRIIANPPFNLGELDVALDPATDEIDIGFERPNGRLPLDNMGSGVQQLLLVLGQIFLNDYSIISIEEPEMNLSPQYQQYLLVALRQLMQDPEVKLSQLFISTHSPYFEFEENFFDVTMDEDGATHVTPLPIEQRDRYFPDTQVGPDIGAQLNSFNQVRLYDGVIEDLGLQRGDLVVFTKNEAGHWEIRPEHEIIQELETVFNDEEN